MIVPARERLSSPTDSIGGLSAVALACQGSDGWSNGAFGVHGTCSMSAVQTGLGGSSLLAGMTAYVPEVRGQTRTLGRVQHTPTYRHVNTKTGTDHVSPEM